MQHRRKRFLTQSRTVYPCSDANTTNPCQNGGICTPDFSATPSGPAAYTCNCMATGYCGRNCEIQEPQGLCTGGISYPVLLQTFGSGADLYNNATPDSFGFSTTYIQRNSPLTEDGMFSFVNQVPFHTGTWHMGEDHTSGDTNGYMFLVNANEQPGEVFRSTINDLSVGSPYEFSAYVANVNKASYGGIKPNFIFEIRTIGNVLVANVSSGDIPETIAFEWDKYGQYM
ncbi:unnamed protein product [Didymodactylos carnosus]|uniref:EGF-like domain-containing protein n=1 Tax=Didymodactylos carnosus TaxID=1234261 RepID=A0A814CXE8_9BILA|nr:unnamed protein product [Didymodactylos carnosus]CAF1138070.1 unnamed protein product [Didymodactylos carnosus]CAF3729462.1 unnamed protein product [Didymodactylos carnosus]CAF3929140.1 unnamed protein product [Didymodactylos carnosus]